LAHSARNEASRYFKLDSRNANSESGKQVQHFQRRIGGGRAPSLSIPKSPIMTRISGRGIWEHQIERRSVGGSMTSIERSVCLRAKACLKVKEFGTPNNEANLSYRDAPVVTDIGGGLCVTYVVDEGTHLKYLQNRDRESSGLSETEIHAKSLENLAELARARIRGRRAWKHIRSSSGW
jgi:hypothetical protein